MHVQAACLLSLLLPPPASGALMLIGADGAGAGRAADRGEAAVMQRVVGNVFTRDKLDDALARPVEQRIDLDQIARAIMLGEMRVRAFDRLFDAQAGDPSIGT